MTYPENPPYTGGPDEVVPTGGLSATGIAALAAISAQDWEDELYGAADTFLTPISELLGKLFDLFAEFVDLDGFIEIASDVLGFFYNLLDRAGFFDLLSGGVDLFGWLADLGVNAIEALIKPIVQVLKWAWELITGLIDVEGFQAFVERIVNALNPLLSATGFADVFTRVVEFFSGIVTLTAGIPLSLEELIQRIPVLSTLVSAITGLTEADGVSLDLGTLQTYFRTLDKQLTDGVAALAAAAQKLLGGIIPVGQISDTSVNLLSQGDFLTSSTVEAGNGWSWDSTRSRTGNGGCLKVDCSGSEQRIYCRQDIRVAPGDRLNLNGYVGTNNFTSGSMRLSIQPWAPVGGVMTAQTVVNGTARTTAANTFQALPELTYTVPAGVTSIQVSLVVNCNSTCDVFFDDIRLTKTGVLPQGLVTNLLEAIQGILNGAGYVAGQGWQFLETAIGFVTGTANDGLNTAENTNDVLFNNPAGGTEVVIDALPVPQLLPSSGSGAILTRTTATPVVATSGRNPVDPGFYNVLEVTPSADIEVVTSSGSYVGAYRALSKGWYLITIGFGGRRITSSGWSLAPLLYKGKTLTLGTGSTSLKPYKVGSEVWATSGAWTRYCQGTFSVFLDAGDYVKAGYDVIYGPLTNTSDPVIDSDTTGVENYFTIALLSKVSD